jgi:hypothetical protein
LTIEIVTFHVDIKKQLYLLANYCSINLPLILITTKKKIYVGTQFWRFQFMVNWLHCFGYVTREHTWREHMEEQSYSPHGQEAKERKRGVPLQEHTSSDPTTSH